MYLNPKNLRKDILENKLSLTFNHINIYKI